MKKDIGNNMSSKASDTFVCGNVYATLDTYVTSSNCINICQTPER